MFKGEGGASSSTSGPQPWSSFFDDTDGKGSALEAIFEEFGGTELGGAECARIAPAKVARVAPAQAQAIEDLCDVFMLPPTTPAKSKNLSDIALATPPPPAKRGGIKAASDAALAGLQPKIVSKEGELMQPCVERALTGNIRTSLRVKTAAGKICGQRLQRNNLQITMPSFCKSAMQ